MSVLRVPRVPVQELVGFGFPRKRKKNINHLRAKINPGKFQTNRNILEKARAQTRGEKTNIALNAAAACDVAPTEGNGAQALMDQKKQRTGSASLTKPSKLCVLSHSYKQTISFLLQGKKNVLATSHS